MGNRSHIEVLMPILDIFSILEWVSSSRFSLGAASTTSLVNSKLSNVKFKFINSNIKVIKGEKFTMRLQIINSSSSPLILLCIITLQ
nr:ALI_HP1_G0023550.mRNA.1.CDS.1 [Saccharomyces cerevisiae]